MSNSHIAEDVVKGIATRLGARVAFRYVESPVAPPLGPEPCDVGLPEPLCRVLRAVGVRRLYKHQVEVLDTFRRGENVVIVSGTGTGKTEAFLIPILESLILSGPATPRPYALVVYPTKALARDQMVRIKMIAEGGLGFKVGVLDGDTPARRRREIYLDPPHILVTNPDMMHYGMAFSESFREIVSRVRVVVLDEMHVYSGVFGTHVAWVMYRLRRLSGGRRLRFMGAGATIGNPGELGAHLFGGKVRVVEGPRRRKGAAVHLFVDQGRASRWTLAASIIAGLAREGFKVLGFVDSHQMAELVARIARKTMGVNVGVHRAGLEASYRRSVEDAFREGELPAVVATPTLELGIDIGDIDAVVMARLPRSYSSYLQRAGRAGRRDTVGLVVTILGEDPIESYFLSRPTEYFSQEVDPAYVEPSNIEVAKLHASALALQEGVVDPSGLPEPLADAFEALVSEGVVRRVKGRGFYPNWKLARSYVESRSLRSSGPLVRIFDVSKRPGKSIGYRELPQALYDLYPGAIYYHGGRAMVALRLDLEGLRAEVRPVGGEVGFYTKPLYTVDVNEVEAIRSRRMYGVKLVYANVKLSVRVEGYVVREEYSGAVLSEVTYESPLQWSYWTKGVLARFPDPGFESLTDAISAYHALEHTLISAARPVVGASDTDLGGISYPSGHIVIYDAVPGGHGASRLVFERMERVVDLAQSILSGCTCEDGCPRCVYSPYCGSGNRFLSRRGALRVVETLKSGASAEYSSPSGRPLA
jgi:DEAD/DEAH box helicase domain-containing protein